MPPAFTRFHLVTEGRVRRGEALLLLRVPAAAFHHGASFSRWTFIRALGKNLEELMVRFGDITGNGFQGNDG